jgi:hypothetical protein
MGVAVLGTGIGGAGDGGGGGLSAGEKRGGVGGSPVLRQEFLHAAKRRKGMATKTCFSRLKNESVGVSCKWQTN